VLTDAEGGGMPAPMPVAIISTTRSGLAGSEAKETARTTTTQLTSRPVRAIASVTAAGVDPVLQEAREKLGTHAPARRQCRDGS
jgi:hypothetical protein